MGELYEERQLGGPATNVSESSKAVREVLHFAIRTFQNKNFPSSFTTLFRFSQANQNNSQRFLRALGYGSVAGRPSQVDEDIQMHADTLYDRMITHEAAVEQAKKDGTPIPIFDPALPKASATKVMPTQELEKTWKEKLDKLPEEERVVEEAALRADLQAKSDVAKNVKQIWASQKEEREARKAGGQATFGDTLSAIFGRGGGTK